MMPPVSVRNSASSFWSPAWNFCRISAKVPQARIFPPAMIPMRSHISSTVSRVWVLMSTVPPRSTKARKRSLRNFCPLGSSPTMGSSTTITSGLCSSALEMISFCRMPWL